MANRLDDGFSTLISFGSSSGVHFWEKNVTPPGFDGGGANDTTTMRNIRYRTMRPKKLVTLSDMSFEAAYDPAVYDDIVDMIQLNQLITVTFSDGSSVAFWGFLDKFTPGQIQEGAQPTASCTIIPSNSDNTVPLPLEVAPAYTA